MVQRMAKPLAVSHFHAGFYQAAQLNVTDVVGEAPILALDALNAR
jgi:hypothetical protein